MSAHVLLNLLNKLGKRDKMGGLLSVLSLFRNKFNKFNNHFFATSLINSIIQEHECCGIHRGILHECSCCI